MKVKRSFFLAKWVILFQIVVSAILLISVPIDRYVSNAIDIWVDQSDPLLPIYHHEQAVFGDYSWLLISVSLDAKQQIGWLNAINDLSVTMGSLPFVADVVSPTTLQLLRESEGYLDYTISEAQTYDALRDAILDDPVGQELLMTQDRYDRVVFLLKEVTDPSSGKSDRQQLVASLQRLLLKQSVVSDFAISGTALINAELNRLSLGDIQLLLPLTVVMSALLLFWMLRHYRYFCIWMLLTTLATTLLTCSLMIRLGFPFNMMTISLPGIIFCLSLASDLHVVQKIKSLIKDGVSDASLMINSLRPPMLISHITTSIGFLSLIFVQVIPVQVMAVFGALGICISLVNSLFVLPIVLWEKRERLAQSAHSGRSEMFNGTETIVQFGVRVFHGLRNFQYIRRLCGALLISILGMAAYGISALSFDSTYIHMVNPEEPLRQYYSTIADEEMIGNVISIFIENHRDDGLIGVADKQAIDDLTLRISGLPNIRKVLSPSQFFESARPFFMASSDPLTLDAVNDIFAFVVTGGNVSVSDYITADFSSIRLQIFMDYLTNKEMDAFIFNELSPLLSEVNQSHPTLHASVSGLPVLWSRMDQSLYRGQWLSIILMFCTAFIMFFYVMRSFKVASIATLINGVPILLILTLFNVVGFEVDMATIFILGISMGVSIDDTSYFICSYHVFRKKMASWDAAVNALKQTASPIIATTFAIMLGFSVLLFSHFIPIKKFGMFVSLGLLIAMIADIILLPYIVAWIDRRRVVV